VEHAYVHALERVAGWRSHGSTLVLLDRDKKQLLRYEIATPLGRWEATAIRHGEALTSPLAGTKITATFARNGMLTGSAGCNRYTTSFTHERGGITIDPPAATKKTCTSPAGIMAQEAAYLAALTTAVSYRVEGGTLALLSADGTYVASYVRVNGSR
jgi:heat shock protein HslJ